MTPPAPKDASLPGLMQGQPREFLSTHWSVVMEAARTMSDEEARAAMGEICRTCWYPLYAHARRQGLGPEAAQDAVQGFFASLVEKHGLETVDPGKGRFRSFLLGALQHWLLNERRAAQTQKRGGGVVHVPLSGTEAEERYADEPPDQDTPERAYDRRWAQSLLERVLARLRAECDAQGRAGRFAVLELYLVEARGTRPIAQAAAELGLSENATKAAIHRLRLRYRAIFREEILSTVGDPTEVDDEIRHLLSVLGG